MAKQDLPAEVSGLALAYGQLVSMPARYEGHEFQIGSPYAELAPDNLAGGILFVREKTFESATLSTSDGNDFFIIWYHDARFEHHRPRRRFDRPVGDDAAAGSERSQRFRSQTERTWDLRGSSSS